MAYSALRAGFTPICFDLFADLDLQAVAQVKPIPLEDYPNKLPELLHGYDRQIPLMYTGGLENHPDLLQELSKQRPVWGYVPKGEGVRSPAFLDALASEDTFARLEHPTIPPVDGSWLLKPKAGSGGRGIRHWQPGEPIPESHFLEEYRHGSSLSALYVASDYGTQLLGITRQMTGVPWLHAPSIFAYSGSIGLLTLDEAIQQRLNRISEQLAEVDPGLRGIFGIDLLVHDDRWFLLEVNPRYTASTEVVELTRCIPTLVLHALANGTSIRSSVGMVRYNMVGKAIYFAPFAVRAPELPLSTSSPFTVPQWADIPAQGTVIRPGEPVCTIFTTGETELAIEASLKERAGWLDTLMNENRVDRLPDQP
jgi:hypothetical protein